MNKEFSIVIPPVEISEQARAEYEAIRLSSLEADSIRQCASTQPQSPK